MAAKEPAACGGRRWDRGARSTRNAKAAQEASTDSDEDGFWGSLGPVDSSAVPSASVHSQVDTFKVTEATYGSRAQHGWDRSGRGWEGGREHDSWWSSGTSWKCGSWEPHSQGAEGRGRKGRGRGGRGGRGSEPGAAEWQPRAAEAAPDSPPPTAKSAASASGTKVSEPSTEDRLAEPPPSSAARSAAVARATKQSPAQPDAEVAASRAEERESLEAIYGPEFEELGPAEWLIRLTEDVSLRLYLPADYPAFSAPTPVVEGGGAQGTLAEALSEGLPDLWEPGEFCVSQWAEHLRAGLQDLAPADDEPSPPIERCANDAVLAASLAAAELEVHEAAAFTYLGDARYGQRRRDFGPDTADPRHAVEIVHSTAPLVDRKSSFVAHFAPVSSMEQVTWVHRQLLSDKKVAAATHNITAYRFCGARGVTHADNDDDGETGAAGRLAELLERRGVSGFLMVSRWYGGIQLGPDRFKDISRTAQLLLDSIGFLGPAKIGAKKGR